jgi:hypothetical protein
MNEGIHGSFQAGGRPFLRDDDGGAPAVMVTAQRSDDA